MRISVAGGRVIDPGSGRDAVGDLHVADGKILAGGAAVADFHPDRTIDAAGRVVCPGLIDLCARLREPGLEHKATIESESRAAARGGFTTLCTPPDTDPVIDTPAVAELIHRRAAESGMARIEIVGALTQGLGGERLAEVGALGRAGCIGVGNASRPIADTEVMCRAMEYAATFGLTVFIEPADPWLSRDGDVHEGAVSYRTGLEGIPEAAETIALARDLLLVELTGVRAHFCHLSSARAVSMVREARARGLPVTADVTVHHLHLTDEAVADFDGMSHVRPPLRSEKDREGLRAGVADGTLGAICTDHQPHERDAKLNPFSATEPGISGLDTALALILDLVAEGAFDLPTAIARLTVGPAGISKLDRGTLEPGRPADVCIFDPARAWTVSEAELVSRGHNTPFIGRRCKGRVTHTLLAGEVVWEETEEAG